MNLALFQRGTPHVEILILVTLGVFLVLWAMLAFMGWIKSKPWRHVPESSLEEHPVDESALPNDEHRSETSQTAVGRYLSFLQREIFFLIDHRLTNH
jgi:hypothetical protein